MRQISTIFAPMKRLLYLISILLSVFFVSSCQKQDGHISHLPTCLEDLRGHNVGVLVGAITDLKLSSLPYNDITISRFDNPTAIIQALQFGKLDAALLDNSCLLAFDLEEQGIDIAFDDIPGGAAAVAFHLQSTELCRQYNDFLSHIKENGVHQQLAERWLSGEKLTNITMPDIPLDPNAPVLKVGMLDADPPFSYISQQGPVGYEVEMILRFAQYAGYSLDLNLYEFTALMPALQSGRVDLVCSMLFITEERAKTILFSDPYYFDNSACIVSNQQGKAGDGLISATKKNVYNNLVMEDRYKIILEGLCLTLLITLFSLIFGTLLGILFCWRSYSKNNKFWARVLRLYGDIQGGLPLLVILMIMFYVVFASTDLSAVSVSIITFSLFFAYSCYEIFRNGIDSIDIGQTEAARLLGFTRFQSFWYVVLPQAIRRILPIYEGKAIDLMQNTSIVGFIAIADLTKAANIIQSRTYNAFFPLIVVSLIYFLLAWLIARSLRFICRKHLQND